MILQFRLVSSGQKFKIVLEFLKQLYAVHLHTYKYKLYGVHLHTYKYKLSI